MNGFAMYELGMPTSLVSVVLLWPFVLLIPRRWPVGRCAACGYDLRGNASGVCPECGTAVRVSAVTETAPDPRTPRRLSLLALAVLLPGLVLHVTFRLAFRPELADYYASPFFGNNAPWGDGARHFLWSLGVPIASCYLAVGVLTWGVGRARRDGFRTALAPLASWVVIVTWFVFLEATWMNWFMD